MSKLIFLSFTGKAMSQERGRRRGFHAITHWGSVKGGEEAGAILPTCGSCLSHISLTWHDLPPLAAELAGYHPASLVDSRKAQAGLPIHPSPSGGAPHRSCFNHINRFPNSALYQIQVPNYRLKIPLPIIPPSI